jgi:cell division protein FtsL
MLKDKLKPAQNRLAIHFILLASIAIPVLIGQVINPPHPGQVGYRATTSSLGHECSADELELCQKRWAKGEFCNCEEISRYKIIAYESNSFYDFFLFHGKELKRLFGMVGLLFLALLIARLFSLVYIVFTARKERFLFHGIPLTLLYHPKFRQVASFRLHRRYIIWNEQLDHLPKEEREAVFEHEWSHLNQGNTFEQILLSVLQVFWFINPAWYAFKKELNKLSELIADEAALKALDPARYSTLLLKLRSQPVWLFVQSFARSLIPYRIKYLLDKSDRPQLSLMPRIVVLLIAFTLISTIAICLYHHETGNLTAYETLSKEHLKTGQDFFCRNCVLGEDL